MADPSSCAALVDLDDVAELRSLLRRADPVARQVAYAQLDDWSGADLDEIGARALLEAAAGTYPAIDGDHRHPGESMARVLWERPRLVPVDEVLRGFLLAGERARRAFIHLLALRRDVAGLEAIESIFGDDGPHELIPSALMPILDPLVEAGEHDRLVVLLCRVLQRDGWVWHAADLLARVQRMSGAGLDEQARVLAAVGAKVDELVQACDRAQGVVVAGSPSGRSEREALSCICGLLDHLERVEATSLLMRLVASADPQVAAMGAIRVLRRGEVLAPERIGLIARDPIARAELYEGLQGNEGIALLHDVVDEVQVHESLLARWLADITEVGRVPDEIEFLETRTAPSAPDGDHDDAVLFVFRFRLNMPHWSAARGWMIGVSGPWTGSCYAAEDEYDLGGHVEEIRTSLATWPGRQDGAA